MYHKADPANESLSLAGRKPRINILGLHSANHYKVTPSLIGWVPT